MTAPDKAHQTSSSMEEVAAKRPEEVRAQSYKNEPREAHPSSSARTPPQSALRADISSIEEERGAKSWLRTRARQMRADMTDAEKEMWRLLHEGELVALNWRKQAVFGDYILDFVSHPARLVVEVDGSQHGDTENVERDAERTAWLNGQGYRVLRFWNAHVLNSAQGVWDSIHVAASATPAVARMARWRADHMAKAAKQNAQIAPPSMGEAPRSGGGGASASDKERASRGSSSTSRASPPLSSLRDDSSPIEGERE